MTRSVRISNYIMIAFLILLMLPMLYITSKVKKLVWKRDKILPIMLVCLTSSVFSFIMYFLFVTISEYHLVWQNDGHQSYTCCQVYFTNVPAFSLSLGIILSLNKWI